MTCSIRKNPSISLSCDKSTFFRKPFLSSALFIYLLGEKLYIIMELIDGAPLGEHFNSLKEKGERFSEDRLWNIFTQVFCWYLRCYFLDFTLYALCIVPFLTLL